MPDCQPLSSGSLCPESSGLTTFFGWLSLTGMVAHFAPDWWLSMVRIIHAEEKAEERGIEKGIERGEYKKAIAIARELKKEGLAIEFIAKTAKLSIEEIEKL